MAKSSVVGALRVTLGLDSAQFTNGMKAAQGGLQRFAGIAKQGALAIGTAMVTAGGVVAVAMKGIIDEADRMSKMSQSLGIPIDQLSKLRYAASLADVDLDMLEKSVRRLSASMFEAGQNATSTAAKSFAMLGVSVRDAEGKMRPATAVVEDLADRFARMPNGVEKTAMAMRIFGKSGADMIPLLNEGKAGLQEMYREAEELGVVLDEKTGKAAEEFNDNLTRLGVVKDGIVTKITASMLPALVGLSNAFVAASRDSATMQRVGMVLGRTLQALATAAITTGGFFTVLASDIVTAATVAAKWAQFDYGGAAAAMIEGTARHNRILATTLAMNRAVWRPPEASGGDGPPIVDALNDVADAGGRARRATERLTDAQREAQRVAAELAREGERVFESTRTPLEQYNAEVARLNRLLAAAAITQDTFNRAMKDARDNFDQADPLTQAGIDHDENVREAAARRREEDIRFIADHEENLRQSTEDGIREGLRAAADGNLGEYLAYRLKESLFDQLAGSLTDLFRGKKGGDGGVMGWIGAVGSMLKTGLPGFKTGGSFKVGGAGGVDSQTVAFRATPGEMVDIRRPGQDQGGMSSRIVVEPSPYFDVRVQAVAAPMVQAGKAQAISQSVNIARKGSAAQQQRLARLGTP